MERIEIEEHYCPTSDITYLMKCTYIGEDIKRMDVIAFYSGEPNKEDTEWYTEYPRTYELFTL